MIELNSIDQALCNLNRNNFDYLSIMFECCGSKRNQNNLFFNFSVEIGQQPQTAPAQFHPL